LRCSALCCRQDGLERLGLALGLLRGSLACFLRAGECCGAGALGLLALSCVIADGSGSFLSELHTRRGSTSGFLCALLLRLRQCCRFGRRCRARLAGRFFLLARAGIAHRCQ
jgi:hypothetical protein